VIAMLNMDMIGRVRDNQIILGGIGTSPAFPALVEAAAKAQGLELKSTKSGYGASDHTSFYVKNVPVLFFFSGLHSDYHRPSDDWDRINAEGATRVLAMVRDIASRLDAWDGRPQFTKVDEPMTTGNVKGAGGGYGTYFGSIPDMTADVKGVRFADIRPNSPAAKAGLLAGDVMIRFAGKEVANLQDFSFLLRSHKPGETVDVTVMRNDQPLTVQVKLDVRR
jgi:Zn-dependent M28 family amino/carboxypeptidase